MKRIRKRTKNYIIIAFYLEYYQVVDLFFTNGKVWQDIYW